MAEVNLPLVGGVSKKALAIGGGAAAAVIGLIYIRKRKAQSSSAATAATGDTSTADTTGTSDYVDPGLQDTSQGPTYGATGYYDPNAGQWVYGNTGTGQAAATTNTQWAQNAIAYLGSNVAMDTAALSAALGAYLQGQALTSDQVSLVDQAIAAEGYPPVSGTGGYPPGIRESGTSSQGGTGGSGGGVTGSGGSSSSGSSGSSSSSSAAGAISNLQAYGVTRNGFTARWNPVPGARGYAYAITELNGAVVKKGTTAATSVSAGGLHPGWSYNVGVQALPGGPGDNIHVALPRK